MSKTDLETSVTVLTFTTIIFDALLDVLEDRGIDVRHDLCERLEEILDEAGNAEHRSIFGLQHIVDQLRARHSGK